MNKIYLGLDKFASYTCDATWNITYTIGEARLNILGYNPKKKHENFQYFKTAKFQKFKIQNFKISKIPKYV